MLWLKAFHIVFVVTWFAGLFYLPRLFVYHAVTIDTAGLERFKVMERRLFGMMTLGGALATMLGVSMIVAEPAYLSFGWLHIKLTLVIGLLGYHAWCYKLMRDLHAGRKVRSERWYRGFNEIPGIFLLAIVLLAVLKPF